LEPLRGYLTLAERLVENAREYACAWNFGPIEGDAKPVSWIADELARLWGKSASWNRDASVHPKEATYLKLDAAKAKAYLGWHPALPLDSALPWIVEWWRTFQEGGQIRSLTCAQIARYETLSQN
jgi:CDP-glucose 4,6-dehydratase